MTFSNGDKVEVSRDGDRAWYEAQVVRTMLKRGRYSVLHDYLRVGDGDGDGDGEWGKPLREVVASARVRPRPRRQGGPFAAHQLVEAWHKDGWWTGVVEAAVAEGEQYAVTVCLPDSWERIEFNDDDLRVHVEWVGGEWVRPEENTLGRVALAFPVRTRIEVERRTRDSLSMWFIATVEKLIWKNIIFIQYESLRADDGGEILREIVDAQYVRPCPPLPSEVGSFSILEEIEVFHDGGWCAGVITRVHPADSKYSVKSEHWKGEMEFCWSQLRLQLEWIDDHWVQASKAKYIKSKKLHQAKLVKRPLGSHARSCAREPRGPVYVSISSDSKDETTISSTRTEGASTLEVQIGHLPTCENERGVGIVEDAEQFSLILEGAARFHVQVEKEYSLTTTDSEEGGIPHIICTSTVQEPCSKKQSKQETSKHLNFDGGNGKLAGSKAEDQSQGQNYPLCIAHMIKDVDPRILRTYKRAKSPRMRSPPRKRKAMGQQTRKKGRCMCRSRKAKAQNTEHTPGGELLACVPLDICLDVTQLAGEEVGEPTQGSPLFLQLDPVLGGDPSRQELSAQEYDVTVFPGTTANETSRLNVVQLNEAVREDQTEAPSVPFGYCESNEIITEEAGVTTHSTPCGSPKNFNSPFVKSSSMWEAIEGIEVLRSLPQRPHFQPLLGYCSDLREGMAIGLMVTFNNVVTGTMKLQITDSEHVFAEKLKMLNHLESYGFDVQRMRDCVEMLQRIKHNHGQHEEKRAGLEELIQNQQNEQQKLTDVIEMIDKDVSELDKVNAKFLDRRSTFAMHRETNDHELTKLETDEKAEAHSSLSAMLEFERALAASW